MRKQFNNEQFDAVKNGMVFAREIVNTGEVPDLSHGWRIGTPHEANFYNEYQERKFVALSHEDGAVLRATQVALGEMGMLPMALGLDTMRFLIVEKPDVE